MAKVSSKRPSNTRSSGTTKPSANPWLKRIGIAFTLIVVITLFGWLILRMMIASTPKFYLERIANQSYSNPDPKDDLEASILNFRNQSRQPGKWKGTFSESSVNRWLTIDLPKKFSNSLPPNLSDPRVAFANGRFQAGIKLKSFWATGVAWVEGRIDLTDQPNTLALHVDRLKFGSLSLPIGLFEKQISAGLSAQRFSGSWVDDQRGRVLIVQVPTSMTTSENGTNRIEAIELVDGKLILTVSTTWNKH